MKGMSLVVCSNIYRKDHWLGSDGVGLNFTNKGKALQASDGCRPAASATLSSQGSFPLWGL